MGICHIIFGGDFVAKYPELIQIDENLSALIQKCDLKVCNFEAPIETNYSAATKSGPSLCQSKESPNFLERLGFNVVTMANNHIMDYGTKACFETIKAFKNSYVAGVGMPKEAYKIQSITIKGKKIGFLALCQYENGIVESYDDTLDCGVAWINSLDVQNIIMQGKEENDYLIILPHAGLEDADAPLPEWRILYKKFVDWGADAIIASHPHAPQGWEIYKNAPIFYSLGNLYFDVLSGGQYWNKGLMVELIIDETFRFKVYNTEFSNHILKLDESEDIKLHNQEINHYLFAKDDYLQYINTCCRNLYQYYQYGILRGICGFSWFSMNPKLIFRLLALMIIKNRDKATLLNTIQCETHRWALGRYLKNNMNN